MSIRSEVKDFLGEIGLSGLEQTIYLACLELGSAPASQIANNVGVNRITAYEVLKRLSKKGFILIRAKKGGSARYFTPVDYQSLVDKMKDGHTALLNKIKRAEELKKDFEVSFPRAQSKPALLFYEGREGIKEVLKESLKNGSKEILSFSSAETLEDGFDSRSLKEYWEKRVALGIRTRGIVPKTEKAVREFDEKRNAKELRALRFLSPSLYQFKNEIDIFGDTIGIMSLTKGNEHGIIIRSREIANSLRAIFETLWQITDNTHVRT